MKKRNLKFLLALVAALALVFAAGCDDSGENVSSGAYESDYSSTRWVYTPENDSVGGASEYDHAFPAGERRSPTYTLKSITLEFPPTSTNCYISVEYIACTYVENEGDHSASNDTCYTTGKDGPETATATYVETSSGVVVTLGSIDLTFTYEAADTENDPDKLVLNYPDGASYTFEGGIDIFDVYGGLNTGENWPRFEKYTED